MILTTLAMGLVGGAAALTVTSRLFRRAARRGAPTAPAGATRRDGAQDVYWEARLLAACRGNHAALERRVNSKARQFPGLKRWQLMRLAYLELTERRPSGRSVPIR
ncbi:hypothetical protein GCM10008959_35720 [Deinococcus seoulensis]|uniref:Transposase n=2 Tax=Deinococcus TaxID=1298 RepID=A0ABQ2RY68_9DEIO|nr:MULTISPECIES: hypothetical protein [Deinococcus]GGR70850.1 hypothetical protein GCM10008959_35720 [Deinococcus seoulensis]GGS41635.1 hypothetical protein GCM10008961_36090 [Deinococcus knuensis]